MPAPELLARLLAARAPTGAEAEATEVWRRAAEGFAETTTDRLGNVVARVRGREERPLLALFGHVDEVGLVVTHVEDDGFLSVRVLGGGVSPAVLLGQRVEILGASGPVTGVVAARHDPQRDDDQKAPGIKDLHVDIGVRTRDDALALVSVGAAAVVAAAPVELAGGRLAARALDDRVGAYVVLEALRRIADDGGLEADVAAVATIGEEVAYYRGARSVAYALRPDVALAVDVTPASDVPGGEPAASGEQALGRGVSILQGPGIDPAVALLLREAADAEGVTHAIEVGLGQSGTDADIVGISRAGIPSGVVSVPARYLHTPIEVVDLADVETAVRVVVAFAVRIGQLRLQPAADG